MSASTRREFFKWLAAGSFSLKFAHHTLAETSPSPLHEAMHYERTEGKTIVCQLEPRQCEVNDGERGFCGARENRGGTYYSLVYAQACAVYAERMEDRGFYHAFPGRQALAIGTAGCNLQCQYCETEQISQSRPEDVEAEFLLPEQVVERAQAENCEVILFTYSEPTVFFEYMLDTARAAKKAGLGTAAHTAGYIHPGPLKEVCAYLDAINLDLKGFSDDFYQTICGVWGNQPKLEAVQKAIVAAAETGTHLEITHLIVPEHNDNPQETRQLCEWLYTTLGRDTPLHLSRFYPNYLLATSHATPRQSMDSARAIAHEVGLRYVYLQNMNRYEDTRCANCGDLLVERKRAHIQCTGIKDGQCKQCGEAIRGVWGL